MYIHIYVYIFPLTQCITLNAIAPRNDSFMNLKVHQMTGAILAEQPKR